MFQIRYFLRGFHTETIGQKSYIKSIFHEGSAKNGDVMKNWGKDYPSYRKLSNTMWIKIYKDKIGHSEEISKWNVIIWLLPTRCRKMWEEKT